jgi:sigma-E factor negative regulatory protein RseC
MVSSSCIEQKGVIEEIANGRAKVRISSFTACSDCHAQNSCVFFGNTTRYIDVPVHEDEFCKGESVQISIKRTHGLKASILAYLIPFVIMIIILILLSFFHINELISGVVAMLTVFLYFLAFYFFRNRMHKAFTFILSKM